MYRPRAPRAAVRGGGAPVRMVHGMDALARRALSRRRLLARPLRHRAGAAAAAAAGAAVPARACRRSEEHTSELQSLMRISYAVFCLKKKNTQESKSIITYI